MRLRTPVLVLAALLALFLPAPGAGASSDPPRDTDDDVVDSPVEAAQVLDQHGGMGGHLPASSANVELVGKVRLTNVPGGVGDSTPAISPNIGGVHTVHSAFAWYVPGANPPTTGKAYVMMADNQEVDGCVILDVTNPAAPAFVDDSNYPTPDPLTGFDIPEGNAHQGWFSSNNQFFLGTDEDFSPTRTNCRI